MSKLVLIDGNAIMHRAYHAIPALTTSGGTPVNAVYGLVAMFFRMISDLAPTHIAVAFDTPEPTFRKKLLPSYQSQRPEMDTDLGVQFELAYKVLEAMEVAVFKCPGFEADDVIATLAGKAGDQEGDCSVVVVTGDRDMLQLVNGNIALYMPVKGLSEAKLFSYSETVERMGVPPEQVVDLKALMGDASDNYKGVPGVGPKTAISLLSKFGSLEEIYKNLDQIPLKTAKLLKENKENAFLSQKLARIVDDVKISFKMEDVRLRRIDNKQSQELFDEFGFRTLKKRLMKVNGELMAEKQMSLI